MKIVFKSIEYRNFMKSGNTPIKLDLNSHPLTLVGGKNGSGKTTLLSAIIFALFGRSERKINKPQLINSINGKNTLVILCFDINSDQYEIHRGLKPNIFKIVLNGVELNEESSIRIDQEYLENHILKMNFKTAAQIFVVSAGNFIPFFGLPAAGKREVIDDILGLSVFSEMKILLKNKIDLVKRSQDEKTQKFNLANEKLSYQKRSLGEIISKLNSSISDKQTQVKDLLENSNRKTNLIEKKRKDYDRKFNEYHTNKNNLDQLIKKVDEEIKLQHFSMKDIVKRMKFFDSNNECPTCFQSISEEQKSDYKISIKQNIIDLNKILEEKEKEQKRLKEEYRVLSSQQFELFKEQNVISELQEELGSLLHRIKFIEKEIYELNTSNILFLHKQDLERDLNKTQDDINFINQETEKLKNELLHLYFLNDMLKDDGIKTKVIRYYLPIINALMEKYLDLFSFFVSFKLDENFNEVIKERHYTEFSYESFSEGEKSRLNLAILFTFRELIKIRNTAQVNLLFLDEIFQSSLDEFGKNVLMEVLQTLSSNGENIFVISHDKDIKDESEFSFSRVLQFDTKNNFSFYTDVSES
jgi:DNA repair exonuclease SbcCD ATPase subunit